MRAEAVSWDNESASNASASNEDDKWHVALAPDEVKIVSLEQLDDLFRLSIVDGETKVWQAGMREWQPLRIIAGIEDEPEPPPAPKRTHPMPPSPRSGAPSPRSGAPSPRSVAPSPRSVSVPPAAPASHYPRSASFYPTTISVVSAPATASFAALAPMQPQSVRPLVVSYASANHQRGGRTGHFLVALAVLAGVGISLYRNDVILDAAHSAHQDALYARFEGALGGPAFGTLRGAEQSSATQGAPLSRDDVASPAASASSAVGAASASAVPAPATASAMATGTTPPVVAPEGETTAAGPAALTAPIAPAAARAAVPSVARAARPVTASLRSAPAVPKSPKAAPIREGSEPQMSEREQLNSAIGRSMMSSPLPSSKSKTKSKASEYDPLNPKL